ncbi:MAG: class I SAM-dependent methyltransferase [Planctomycetota bacterium]|nr:class I SAM-dependent methyltransferase [Planctomycetota bacterium]
MRYLVPAIERIYPEAGPGTRVLDVGCGNGYLANQFAQKGCTVVGIDASRMGIGHARQAYPQIRFEQQLISEHNLDDLEEDPFDLVVSTEVVEHLYAPRIWAKGAFHALRPGGDLVATTPHHGYVKNLVISLKGGWDNHWKPLKDGGHIKFWSKRTLSMLLEEAGFEDLRFVGAGRAPFLWMSMVVRGRRPD